MSKTNPKNPPSILKQARARIARLFPALRHDRHWCRGMKQERQAEIMRLASTMAKLICLDPGPCLGAAVLVKEGFARPVTVAELAQQSGLPEHTVERCLNNMKIMGLLKVGRQERRRVRSLDCMTLSVSGVLRTLTDKFWRALDLGEEFRRAIQRIKELVEAGQRQAVRLVFPRYPKLLRRSMAPAPVPIREGAPPPQIGGQDSSTCLSCRFFHGTCPRACSRLNVRDGLKLLGYK